MIGEAVERAVAIVGDDAGMRDSVAVLLELHGFRVRQFARAEAFLAEALPADAVAAAELGCLVLDLSQPGMTGLDLLERLAAAGAPPPSILISAEVTAPVAERAHTAGARLVLGRPVPPLELVAHVRALAG